MTAPVITRASLEYAESFAAALDAVARERRHLLMVEGPPLQSVREFVGNVAKTGGVQFFALDPAELAVPVSSRAAALETLRRP